MVHKLNKLTCYITIVVGLPLGYISTIISPISYNPSLGPKYEYSIDTLFGNNCYSFSGNNLERNKKIHR